MLKEYNNQLLNFFRARLYHYVVRHKLDWNVVLGLNGFVLLVPIL